MSSRLAQFFLTGAGLSAGLAIADTVALTGKPPFHQVTITDFRSNRLVFHGQSRAFLSEPLAEVDWLAIDARPELSAAEEAARDGDWTRALPQYAAAFAKADKAWLRDLVHRRYLSACDRAGAFDRAVDLYVSWLEACERPAGVRPPGNPGPFRSETNVRALRQLEAAQRRASAPAVADALSRLLLEVLIYEEVEQLPGIGPSPAASRPASKDRGGVLAPQGEPGAATQPAVNLPPAVVLGADSLVLRAAQAAFDVGNHDRATRLLERALPYVGPVHQAPWRLLLARCRLETGLVATAAADLIELATSDTHPAHAATALFYAAAAYERLHRFEAARGLYEDVLRKAEAPIEIRMQARAAVARLGP